MQRRTWTAGEKPAMVLAGLKQTQSVAELCRPLQISQTQYYKWRDQFLEGGKQALQGAKHDTTKQLERKAEQLEQIIGKQTENLPGIVITCIFLREEIKRTKMEGYPCEMPTRTAY